MFSSYLSAVSSSDTHLVSTCPSPLHFPAVCRSFEMHLSEMFQLHLCESQTEGQRTSSVLPAPAEPRNRPQRGERAESVRSAVQMVVMEDVRRKVTHTHTHTVTAVSLWTGGNVTLC